MPPVLHPSSSKHHILIRPRAISAFISDTTSRIRLRGAATALGPEVITARDITTSSRLSPRKFIRLPDFPAHYQGINAGPSSGVVVGIVLGVVLGTILVSWLIVAIIGNRANAQYVEGDDTEIVVRRGVDHSSRRSRRTRTRRSRSSVSEMSSRPAPRPQRTERILVQETRRTETSRPPPPMSATSERHTERVNERESVNVREESRTERRVEGDDMVEVIEEHTSEAGTADPPRRKRSSGYRTVDPNAYAGGNYPQRDVYNDRRSSRRNR